MAFDTRSKRAAMLGFGLASMLVLPLPDAAISIDDAGHLLSGYRFDFVGVVPVTPHPVLLLDVLASRETVLTVLASRETSLTVMASRETMLSISGLQTEES